MTNTKAPLSPRALYEDVAERLRQQIFSGVLPAGAWIDELRIADDYGISRTPLREALKVLAAEGLVTMKVRRGAYVTEVSAKDLSDVYHLLALLEGDAAAAVALGADAQQLQTLAELHDELERSVGDAERFFALNERFHLALLHMADNRWREQLVSDLRKVMKLNRHASLQRRGRIEQALAEHRAILQAMRQRDPQAAAAAVRAHFDGGLQAASSEARD